MSKIKEIISNYYKRYKEYRFITQKQKVLKSIEDAKSVNVRGLSLPWRTDYDVASLLVKKFGKQILNKYTNTDKMEPFFSKILEGLTKDEEFSKIVIPSSLDRNFHMIQSIIKEEENSAANFHLLDMKYQQDPNVFAIALKMDKTLIEYMRDEFFDHERVAKEMVPIKPEWFEKCSIRVKDAESVAIRAIIYDERNYYFMSERLKKDEKFLIRVLSYKENLFPEMPESFKNNPKIIDKLIKENVFVIKYLPEITKNDEFMKKLVENNPRIISHASMKIQTDKEIAKLIMEKNPDNFRYLTHHNHNKDFAMQAVSKDGMLLEYCCDDLKNDLEVVTKAVEHKPSPYLYVGDDISSNQVFTFDLLARFEKIEGAEIKHILIKMSDKFYQDSYIINLISKSYPDMLRYVPSNILHRSANVEMITKNYPEFVKTHRYIFGFKIPNSISAEENKKIVRKLVEINPLTIEYIDFEIKDSREFYMTYGKEIEDNKEILTKDYLELNRYLREENLFDRLAENEKKKLEVAGNEKTNTVIRTREQRKKI